VPYLLELHVFDGGGVCTLKNYVIYNIHGGAWGGVVVNALCY
jgi:hypothetical protein